MPIRYTREEFEKTFKSPISKLLDLQKFVTAEIKTQAMRHPTASIVTFEYSTAIKPESGELITCIEMQWWIGDDNHLKGMALAVTIFEDQKEMRAHRQKVQFRASPDFNLN